MKTLLLLAALVATPTLAAELPITGAYGTPSGCRLYAEGGTNYVMSAFALDDSDDRLLVKTDGMWTWEANCSSLSDKLGAVSFSCNDGDNPFTLDVTLTLKGDKLIWAGDDAADGAYAESFVTELSPCSASETPLT